MSNEDHAQQIVPEQLTELPELTENAINPFGDGQPYFLHPGMRITLKPGQVLMVWGNDGSKHPEEWDGSHLIAHIETTEEESKNA